MEKQSHFAIVNMKTATTAAVSVGSYSRKLLICCDMNISESVCVQCAHHLHHFNLLSQVLVLSQVDRVLDEVDWLIARKKSQTASDKSGSGKTPFFPH